MAIRFRCYHCQKLFSIASRMRGEQTVCPNCGTANIVPEVDDAVGMPLKPSTSIRPNETPPSPASPASEVVHDPSAQARSASRWEETSGEDEGISLRKPVTEFEEMDLTPMVDVTFLLLIFFMITASFTLQKSIEVPAPSPKDQGAAQSLQTLDDLQTDSVIVEVDRQNTIYIDDEKLEAAADLAETLREKMRLELKSELVLMADTEAFHETVIAVIDAANAAGMQKIRLASSAPSQ